MKQFIGRNKSVISILFVGIIIISASSWGWWHYVYSNPKRVFNRMLSQSLSTPSVTKSTIEPDSTKTLRQTTQLSVNPTPAVRSVSQVKQGDSLISTENIASPQADYVRYTGISTSQKGENDKPLDFSQILGVWGQSTNDDPTTEGAQLFNQTALGVVPLARLSVEDKKALLKQIAESNVYIVDYDNVTRSVVDGRPVYSYKVGLTPRAYVAMLKTFSRNLGNDELALTDPNDYPESPALNVGITIDVWSSQLRQVTYEDSPRVEDFSSHGALVNISMPTEFVSLPELQAKLQQIR